MPWSLLRFRVLAGPASDWLDATGQGRVLESCTNVNHRDQTTRRPDAHAQLTPAMASKYAFNAGLKELRFLFCQTSEASAATRYAPA